MIMTKKDHSFTRESSLYADSKSLKTYYKKAFSVDKPMRRVDSEKDGYLYLKDACNKEYITDK